MRLQYQFNRSDFRPLMRHNHYWRLLGWTAVMIGLTFLPSLLTLWAVGMRQAPVGAAVGYAFLVTTLHWMMVRGARRSFLKRANDHTVQIEPDYFEHASSGRWYRANGRFIRGADVDRRHIVLRRSSTAALIPRRALGDAEAERQLVERQLVERLRAIAAAVDAPPPPAREIEGTKLQEVEFRYSDAELNDLREQRFVPNEGRGSVLWLVAFAFLLVSVLTPEVFAVLPGALVPVPLGAGVLLALLLPIVTWRGLGPLRRRLNQLSDDVLGRQRVALWSSGVEHAGEHFQSFIEWPHIARLGDGRDYLLIYGDTGGWSAVPRRVFADPAAAQEFLETAARQVTAAYQQQEADESGPLPPRVETGNPYQSPGGTG